MFRLLVLICLIFAACGPADNKKISVQKTDSLNHTFLDKQHLDTLSESRFNRSCTESRLNDSITTIELFAGVHINWNNRSDRIEKDSFFQKIRDQFPGYRISFANEIRNEAITGLTACPDGQKVRVGDIAFLIIDEIDHIPIAELTHFQLDVFQGGCQYPYGLFDLLQKHRAYMTKCVKDFVHNQARF